MKTNYSYCIYVRIHDDIIISSLNQLAIVEKDEHYT